MKNTQFERVKDNKPDQIFTKMKGKNAKDTAIILAVGGVLCGLFILILHLLNEFQMFIDISFSVFGLLCIVGAINNLVLNKKHQKFLRPILENGMLTDGFVLETEYTRLFNGLAKRRYRCIVKFWYRDENGAEHTDKAIYIDSEKMEFCTDEKIKIAFFAGNAVMGLYWDTETCTFVKHK